MKVADLFALLSIKVDKAGLKRVGETLDGLKRTVKRVAVGFAAATAGGLAMVNSVAQNADQFAKLSKKVGISVEKLQQLEFAAQISGSNIDVLRTGLQRFARTADDVGQGLDSAKEPFERLNVNVNDSTGQLKDLDTLLLDVASQFKEMPDGTAKTALAMKMFGRSGAELIPLLNEGADGIERLREEFAATGAQISTEDAKAFEEYNDTIHRVKTTVKGFMVQAVTALLPQLQELATQFREWASANREVIKQNLTKFVTGLIAGLKLLAKVIGFVLKHARILIALFVSWKVVTLALAAAQAFLAATAKSTARAVMMSWIKALAPFLLLVAVVVAIALLIEDIWVAINGGESVVGEFVEFLKDAFWDAVEAIREFFVDLFDWVADKVLWLANKLKDMANKVKDYFGGGPGVSTKAGDVIKRETKRGASPKFIMAQLRSAGLDQSPEAQAFRSRNFSEGEMSQRRNLVRSGGDSTDNRTINVTNYNQTTDPERAARQMVEGVSREVQNQW